MSVRHSLADSELIRQVAALGCCEPRFDRTQEPVAFEAWATRAVAVIAARYTPDLPARRAEADRHANARVSLPRCALEIRGFPSVLRKIPIAQGQGWSLRSWALLIVAMSAILGPVQAVRS